MMKLIHFIENTNLESKNIFYIIHGKLTTDFGFYFTDLKSQYFTRIKEKSSDLCMESLFLK
jgi:hypothetical protein